MACASSKDAFSCANAPHAKTRMVTATNALDVFNLSSILKNCGSPNLATTATNINRDQDETFIKRTLRTVRLCREPSARAIALILKLHAERRRGAARR